MSGGLDKLCAQAAERAEGRVRMSFDNWQYAIESPIERLFLIGIFVLLDARDFDYLPFEECEVLEGDKGPGHPAIAARIASKSTLLIRYQQKLLDWKADFVLSCAPICDAKVVVECDGHDYHERTKEQAARDRKRDRAAQSAGYTIFRFTGSEIYRDPIGCSHAALTAITKLAEKPWLESVDQ